MIQTRFIHRHYYHYQNQAPSPQQHQLQNQEIQSIVHSQYSAGRDRVPIDPKNQKSLCPACNQFVCRDSQSMVIHRQLCISPTTCCRECWSIFLSRQQLIDHKKICIKSMNKQRLKSKSIDNDVQIDNEYNENNRKNIIYFCTFNQCGKVFKSKKTLNQHIKRHTKPYKCTYNGCIKSFGSSWDRKIHGLLLLLFLFII